MFLAGLIVFINANDGAPASFSTRRPLLDYVRGSLLICAPAKFLMLSNASAYIRFQVYWHGFGLDHCCVPLMPRGRPRKGSCRDGFVWYELRTGEVYGLEGESIQPTERISSEDEAPSSIVLPAVPLLSVKV